VVNARWLVVLSILVMCQACSLSGHRVIQSTLGTASSLAEMEKLLDEPGPIDVETINSAVWTVALAGESSSHDGRAVRSSKVST
jgi:N-acyl homoserine lactone hydrolase